MSKRSVTAIIIIIILIISGYWAFNVSSNMTKNLSTVAEETEQKSDNTSIEELIITETKDGKKFWEVYASSGQYNSGKNVARLTNVKGNFYKNNKVVLSFDAPLAFYTAKNKEIKLQGGARAANAQNILIKAKEFSWQGNKDEIVAKGNVKVVKSDEVLITSDKSIFSTDFKRFKVIGNSTTNVYKKN